MGQTFRFVLFLSSVLYCPLVSIPSNSSTTEYKLATAISSPVHVIRHLGPGLGSNISSSSAAALASCPASSFMLSSCHASPVMDFAFSQTCTLRKDRHVVIHVEGRRVQAGLNLSKIQVFWNIRNTKYYSCHKLLNGHVITENRILSSNFIQVWKINKFLPISDFHKQTGKRVYKA